jgi:glycerol-3-phosphate dehydrogenase
MSEGRTASYHLRPGEPAVTPVAALPAEVDLCVVGGGIYGAWTALEAALRGQRVALVERRSWASGTSCASSKLIHGGLRYLEHGHVALVRTALAERGLLLRLAPHRVRPLTFLVPVTRSGRLTRLHLHLGLRAYDWLAGRQAGVPRMASWSRLQLLAGAPFLDPAGLLAGFSYGDAGTDDAALTRDVVAAAQAAGAVCVDGAPVAGLLRSAGRVSGIQLADGRQVAARASVLAAGPWACALAGLDPQRHVRFTKGVHIELPPLPLLAPFAAPDTALLLTAPQDGRVFFAIPWRDGTMVGTTDTDFTGDPDSVRVEEADIAYLLAALASTCPGLGFRREDVRRAWCGLRTLAHAAGGASALSREWSLLHPEPGLWLPIGGKLTTARADAVRIVEKCQMLEC